MNKALAGDAACLARVSGDEDGSGLVALWDEEALGVPGPDNGVPGPEVPQDDNGTARDEVEVPSCDISADDFAPFRGRWPTGNIDSCPLFLRRGSRKKVVVIEWTVWLDGLGHRPLSAELASEREDSDMRLSSPLAPLMPLVVAWLRGRAGYWDPIEGTGGASIVWEGASPDADFLGRLLIACSLFALASSDFAVAARRNRPDRLIRDDFFWIGSTSVVGAVVMMLGATNQPLLLVLTGKMKAGRQGGYERHVRGVGTGGVSSACCLNLTDS